MVFLNVVSVSAQSGGITSNLTLSLSGGQSISHSFDMNVGDRLNLTYSVASKNESTCMEVAVNYEASTGLPLSWDNRSSLPPYSMRSNGTQVTAFGKQTVQVTYSACPQIMTCKGQASINVTYSLGLGLLNRYQNTVHILETLQWWLVGGLVVAIALIVVASLLYLTKKNNTATMSSSA